MLACSILALLVPKKDGTMRMCTGSRAINNITIKYRYPISRHNGLLYELHSSNVFSHINLRNGYHEIRMIGADE